jgi:hypothetical protein
MRLKDLPGYSQSPTFAGGEMQNMLVRDLVDAARRSAQNVEMIRDASDLPSPSGGSHPLKDGHAYLFDGYVTSDASLALGNPSLLYSLHGGYGGFVHTGGDKAVVGSGGPLLAHNMLLHAPGGQVYDVSGTASDEVLVSFVNHGDPLGLGNIASLGRIDGMRVPTWKICAFEDFDDGLTFDGNPAKAVFTNCPFRSITASNVTIIKLAGSLDLEIFKLAGAWVKDVQADTTVIDAKAGSKPALFFKYLDVDHDTSVSKSNILVGDVGRKQVGTIVKNSFPIADSEVIGELDLDSVSTITGSGSSATEITAATTLENAAKMDSPSNGRLRYQARYDQEVRVAGTVGVSGANTAFEVSIALNGSVLSRSKTPGFTANSSEPTAATATTHVSMTAGDELSIFLENVGGASDLDAEFMTLIV